MINDINNKSNTEILKTGLICFILAFFSLIVFIVHGNGFFVLTNDFNDQQIPFTVGLHNALLESGLSGFSWDVDLGTSTLDAFSFYELGSPFFWITMLFPKTWFPYMVAWIYMLKYAVAGMIAYAYLRMFVKESKWAVVGAVLYAFSGYSTINLIFYHFHDVIALFPLVLIALERVIREKKGYLFLTFTLAINCLLNYYFFIGECVFVVIYYLFRLVGTIDVKDFVNRTIRCIGSGVLAVGMACILFLPSVLFISGNPRSQTKFVLSELLIQEPKYFLHIVKNMLLPAEAMTSLSAIDEQKFHSIGLCLPLVGLALVFAYIKKNRDRLSVLIIFLLVGSLVPLVSDGFFLYTSSQMRWWFMLDMMMALASIRVLEDREEYDIRFGVITQLVLIAILYLVLEFNPVIAEVGSLVLNRKKLLVYIAIEVVGLIAVFVIGKSKKEIYKVALVATALFALGTTFLTTFVYYKHSYISMEIYRGRFEAAKQTELPNEQYRLSDTYNLMSMVNSVAGFSNQCSTDTNSIGYFEDLFDFYDGVSAIDKNSVEGLSELLGGKYYYSINDADAPSALATYETSYWTYYLMEREACPIGFAVDSYITEDELRKLDVSLRGKALLDSAVVTAEDASVLADDLAENTAEDIDVENSVSDYVSENSARAVGNFALDGHGMTCTSSYDEDTWVYFSVPFDDGWTATIDGQKTDIVYSGGMMLIKVPAGQHDIVFTYYTPGLKAGMIISAISWVAFIALVAFTKKRGGNK
ncbi:YfhO family protein [Pseudobutyrivibrio sp.]|uniref:YfhO family protein n=1 Tax=Pseudobutyrivibrio sp. TaxID=2014367 RepID=UPI001DA2CF16|nr:YfhO family protein [Pseudobutyrivibrio sp.]MBE5910016.1 hypothetical protein [Pseudobutyrivibrio sp.]